MATPTRTPHTAERGRSRYFAAALVTVTLLVGLAAAVAVQPAAAEHVAPIPKDDNPSCADLAPPGETWIELKVQPVEDGTYSDGTLTVTIDVRDTAAGNVVDWTSNIGLDAVFVKGGPSGNLYQYDPPSEETSDTGLHPQVGPSGDYLGLSHLSFCYDIELQVSKTATTTFTRTYHWNIDKSVTPSTWDLFTGDTGTSAYTVNVTKTGFTDSDWAVSGTISITNPGPGSATVTGVSDEISGVGAVSVSCGVSFPHSLAAGATLNCTYSSPLPNGSSRVNTATATTSGDIEGGSGTANVTFGSPTTEVNASVDVTDSVQGGLGSFSDSGSVSYNRTFACDADEGTHNNTATIVQTGQSDSASVTVNCHQLSVTKNANTSLRRTWRWTIDKSADQTELLLSVGQTFLVNYSVTVNATSSDSNFAVSGNIAVNNPAPVAATINGVADIVSPAIAATVNCGVTFPYSLAAGATLNCTYSASLPDASNRTNTATATQQNYAYNSAGVGTPSGTTDYSGTASVSFASATVEQIDECINVSDSYAGALGTVCASDPLPKTFTYQRTIGPITPEQECSTFDVPNVASFVTNDTATTGQDNWNVVVTVPCRDVGCTLTPGYWKTHSDRGPAPFDDTWNLLGPLAEDTIFFLSTQTYYQVLWTAPQGNVYYILAHAYIAAQLNMLNGASVPTAVQTAFDSATALFATKTPAQAGALKGAARNAWISLATILDNYNNGITGPGHCSE